MSERNLVSHRSEFEAWLKQCPVQYDFSHEIENEDDWQLYIYFILDKEVQEELTT